MFVLRFVVEGLHAVLILFSLHLVSHLLRSAVWSFTLYARAFLRCVYYNLNISYFVKTSLTDRTYPPLTVSDVNVTYFCRVNPPCYRHYDFLASPQIEIEIPEMMIVCAGRHAHNEALGPTGSSREYTQIQQQEGYLSLTSGHRSALS